MTCQLRTLPWIGLTLLASLACEKIIGIETKHHVAAPANACGVIDPNPIGLRVANMITGDARVDVCVAPSGAAFGQPLLASGGSECPPGVGYGQYTVRLNVAVGTYDVKLVPYGSGCSAEGPQLASVRVEPLRETSTTSSTTVVAFGKDWSAAEARLVALRDADSTGVNIYLRFFHALVGGGSLDAGLVNPNQTPAMVTSVTFPNVSFGSVAQSSATGGLPVDDDGYMIYPVQSSDVGGLNLGAAATDSTNREAFVSSFVTLTRQRHYTLFLVGQHGDPKFPPKLWSCDEMSNFGGFADCGEPRAITVGMFHPNLTDIFTDYIDVRQQPALDAIASSDPMATGSSASALCVPELYSPESRAELKEALGNTATVIFSDDYPIAPESDLTDQLGVMPQYKDVVCDGDLTASIHALETCFLNPQLQEKGCIAAAEADAGAVTHHFAFKGKQAIGCAAEACQGEVQNLVFSESFDSHACFMCAIAHLSSGESIEDMYSACSSPSGGKHHFVYGGATGLALILRQPLVVALAPGENPEVVALPASTWNRAGMRVPVRLPNNAVIDVWCASVRAPNSEYFMPNGGPYHGDASPAVTEIERANANEEGLQISRLLAAVSGRSASTQRRAVVAALTYASPHVEGKVTGLHPENFALFDAPGWHRLVARDYEPACTFCGDNPLNSPQDNQWMEHIFGVGIQQDAVTETQRTFMGRDLNLVLYSSSNESPATVPVSQYYGIQSTVRISQ